MSFYEEDKKENEISADFDGFHFDGDLCLVFMHQCISFEIGACISGTGEGVSDIYPEDDDQGAGRSNASAAPLGEYQSGAAGLCARSAGWGTAWDRNGVE